MNAVIEKRGGVPPDFDLAAYLARGRRRVDRALEAHLAERPGAPAVDLAMRHSLMAGGKRLRPILCLAAGEAVSDVDCPLLMPAACALEMVHTYSLIHDDLPAMDDDELRRGRPTCHVAFDEATAILAGDALLTLAFEVLARPAAAGWREAQLAAIRILAAAAGHRGMIEGQMRDISAEGRRLGREELEQLHRLKTGALIRASVRCGAELSRAGPGQVEALDTYANRIGLAFQVADDLLDIEGDPAVMGKAAGADDRRGKNTYPRLLGTEPSRRLAVELSIDALQSLSDFDNKADPLRAIAHYIVNRRR